MATSQVLEPLEAEAHALLLGARLAAALNLQVATLLTDNQVVALAAKQDHAAYNLDTGRYSLLLQNLKILQEQSSSL